MYQSNTNKSVDINTVEIWMSIVLTSIVTLNHNIKSPFSTKLYPYATNLQHQVHFFFYLIFFLIVNFKMTLKILLKCLTLRQVDPWSTVLATKSYSEHFHCTLKGKGTRNQCIKEQEIYYNQLIFKHQLYKHQNIALNICAEHCENTLAHSSGLSNSQISVFFFVLFFQ